MRTTAHAGSDGCATCYCCRPPICSRSSVTATNRSWCRSCATPCGPWTSKPDASTSTRPSSMQIDIFTLFPEWFDWFLGQRHVRNALRLGHDVRLFNYRDTTPLSAGQVDDSPYGGGAGMVIRVDVVDAALQAVYGPDTEAMLGSRRVAVLAASGRRLDEAMAEELAGLESPTLL